MPIVCVWIHPPKKLCSLPCLTRLKTWKLNFLPRFGGDEFTPPPTLLPKKKGWRGLAKRCSDVIFVSRPLKAAEMSLRRCLSEFASPPPTMASLSHPHHHPSNLTHSSWSTSLSGYVCLPLPAVLPYTTPVKIKTRHQTWQVATQPPGRGYKSAEVSKEAWSFQSGAAE